MEFVDPEYSWQVFILLESFKKEDGSWAVMDVIGKPVMELGDSLVKDLLTWRFLKGIIDNQKNNPETWMNSDPSI